MARLSTWTPKRQLSEKYVWWCNKRTDWVEKKKTLEVDGIVTAITRVKWGKNLPTHGLQILGKSDLLTIHGRFGAAVASLRKKNRNGVIREMQASLFSNLSIHIPALLAFYFKTFLLWRHLWFATFSVLFRSVPLWLTRWHPPEFMKKCLLSSKVRLSVCLSTNLMDLNRAAAAAAAAIAAAATTVVECKWKVRARRPKNLGWDSSYKCAGQPIVKERTKEAHVFLSDQVR